MVWHGGGTFQARDAYHILGNKRTTMRFCTKSGRKESIGVIKSRIKFHVWRKPRNKSQITAIHSKPNRVVTMIIFAKLEL